MPPHSSRRSFVKAVVTAGAAATGAGLQAPPANGVSGFDHVALPMQNTDAMVAFYRGLGFRMSENANAVSGYVGSQMINFHRPAHWQDPSFTLRAPAAKPPCGDLCLVWNGSAAALTSMLARARVPIELG